MEVAIDTERLLELRTDRREAKAAGLWWMLPGGMAAPVGLWILLASAPEHRATGGWGLGIGLFFLVFGAWQRWGHGLVRIDRDANRVSKEIWFGGQRLSASGLAIDKVQSVELRRRMVKTRNISGWVYPTVVVGDGREVVLDEDELRIEARSFAETVAGRLGQPLTDRSQGEPPAG